MTIKKIFPALFLSLFCVSLAQGQISINKVDMPEHHHEATTQDSSYHCGLCDSYLFGVHEATILNNEELHYHGIASAEGESSFHCAGCNGHLGYYQHDDDTYKVSNDYVNKKEDHAVVCLHCQLPIFDATSLTASNDTHSYFKKPIAEERVKVDDRYRFFNFRNPENTDIGCGNCGAHIGQALGNDNSGFGLRLNIASTKKKKRNRK